jgi:hypothetical protein
MAPPATRTRDPSVSPRSSCVHGLCHRGPSVGAEQMDFHLGSWGTKCAPNLGCSYQNTPRQWTNSGESMENRVTNRHFIPIIHYQSLSFLIISYHSIISSLSQSLMLSWTWRLNTALGFATGSAWWLQAQILSDRLPSSKIWKLSHSWFEGRLWNYSHRARQNQSHNHPRIDHPAWYANGKIASTNWIWLTNKACELRVTMKKKFVPSHCLTRSARSTQSCAVHRTICCK